MYNYNFAFSECKFRERKQKAIVIILKSDAIILFSMKKQKIYARI